MNLISLEIPQTISIDKKEIKRLFEIKVISAESYVYFALKLTQGKNKNVEVDIADFAEEWNISEWKARKLINSLEEKGGCSTNQPEIIQLSLF
jgi:hypothetical protein